MKNPLERLFKSFMGMDEGKELFGGEKPKRKPLNIQPQNRKLFGTIDAMHSQMGKAQSMDEGHHYMKMTEAVLNAIKAFNPHLSETIDEHHARAKNRLRGLLPNIYK